MLGDDEEEDLEALVAACSNQIDNPVVIRDEGSNSPHGNSGSPGRQGRGRTVDPTIKALLDQNMKLMEMVKQT